MFNKFLSVILGAIVTISFFYILSLLVVDNDDVYNQKSKTTSFDFIRNKQESELEPKSRIKPPVPEQKVLPSAPKINIAQNTTSKPTLTAVKINTPQINLPTNIKGDLLANASVGGGNMDIIPLVRIPPIYPEKALRMQKEGFVKMSFIINTDGSVRDAKVIQSEPRNFFDDAALHAIQKWKFKPKLENGIAVIQEGEQTITFSLGNMEQ